MKKIIIYLNKTYDIVFDNDQFPKITGIVERNMTDFFVPATNGVPACFIPNDFTRILLLDGDEFIVESEKPLLFD